MENETIAWLSKRNVKQCIHLSISLPLSLCKLTILHSGIVRLNVMPILFLFLPNHRDTVQTIPNGRHTINCAFSLALLLQNKCNRFQFNIVEKYPEDTNFFLHRRIETFAKSPRNDNSMSRTLSRQQMHFFFYWTLIFDSLIYSFQSNFHSE